MVKAEALEILIKINELYNELCELINLKAINSPEHLRYTKSIQVSTVSSLLSRSAWSKQEIEWIILTTRNLQRYFDEVRRHDFHPSFFIELNEILTAMHSERTRLGELLQDVSN
jgi:hypothetical protein